MIATECSEPNAANLTVIPLKHSTLVGTGTMFAASAHQYNISFSRKLIQAVISLVSKELVPQKLKNVKQEGSVDDMVSKDNNIT